MELRRCGASDLTLSALGLGCWSFGGGDYWGPQDQKDVEAVVGLALERGVNFFDTAEGYNEGRSEEALGLALKGRRQKAVIGTKVAPNHTQPAVLRQQAEDYAGLFRAFRRHSANIARISFWNLHDGESWLNYFPWRRQNYPLLFDRNRKPKPAYDSVITALRGDPVSSSR